MTEAKTGIRLSRLIGKAADWTSEQIPLKELPRLHGHKSVGLPFHPDEPEKSIQGSVSLTSHSGFCVIAVPNGVGFS